MKLFKVCLVSVLCSFFTSHAATFTFNTDPFAGSDALTTPGRQVVGGEPFITFDIASDLFALAPDVFGAGSTVSLANDVIGNVPATGVNTVVLRTFDNDNDSNTPFGAGNAANLIAAQLTSPQPGFFIYFNSGLDLPRLVYSTDLNDNTSDLKILARLTNLGGQPGRDALPGISAENFQFVPDGGASLLLLCFGASSLFAARTIVGRRS